MCFASTRFAQASRVADVPALRPHANDGSPSDARPKKQFQTPLGRATCLTGDAPGRSLETKAVAPPDKPPSDLVGSYVSLVSQTRQPRATGAPCVDVEAGVKLRKRAKFNPPAKREPAKVPMASQINTGAPVATLPPTEVMDLIGDNDLVVGVDIETHDWETNAGSKGYVGQYGFYTRCDSDDHAARIVQLGWAISANGAETRVKELLVKPNGFRISDKAARLHGTTHDVATSQGQPLRDVLSEFIGELLAAHASGGRVVIHHLEFDAGIINREFERAGLQCYQAVWAQIARAGMCTMDPAVGKWVRTCLGMEVAPYPNGNTIAWL